MADRRILNLPKHSNPGQDRTASAPYNFVPLPETVVSAVEDAEKDLPDHDHYYPDRHTGYFDVTLTTKSPLYVRCPLEFDRFMDQQRRKDANLPYRQQVKNTPDFFYTRDPNEPVIPGSSLRGMLRSLLEIVSYGKMQWVTDKKLFFRTMDKSAIAGYYRNRMSARQAGYLVIKGSKYCIRGCAVAQVPRAKLGGNLYQGDPQNQVPRWQGQPRQYAPVWVQLQQNSSLVDNISYKKREGWTEGRLVITGHIGGKKREFVFLLPDDNTDEIEVSEDVINRFHDDDQLTQWQERAFPVDQPSENSRQRPGMLRSSPSDPGDPVFFLCEAQNGKMELTFLGRAGMFRLPYRKTPLDLVHKDLYKPTDMDYAEALFGFVRSDKELKAIEEATRTRPEQGKKGHSYASRIFVTDAILSEGQSDIWLVPVPNKPTEAEPITPKILATPKPTAFQIYLTQQDPDEPKQLDHYDTPPPHGHRTTIRGHKRYWHQALSTAPECGLSRDKIRDAIEETREARKKIDEDEENGKPDTQHTQFKPLAPGVRFTFRINFENLSDRELGALCWTLHPVGNKNDEYCHSLGMGKPLGMGAVKLQATLYLSDRQVRYGSLLNGDTWQTGLAIEGISLSDPDTLEEWTRPFEWHVLDSISADEESCKYLLDMKRIGVLLKLMEWPGFRPVPGGAPFLMEKKRPNTRNMTLEEFKRRLVLPSPANPNNANGPFGELTGSAEPQPAT